MKKSVNTLIALLILIFLPIFFYLTVLSQSSTVGLLIVLLVDITLLLLIILSLFGMIKGKIRLLKIRTRLNSLLLFFISIVFLLYVSTLGILSILFEIQPKKGIPSLQESMFAISNLFIPLPYREGLLTEKFNGLTFIYPKGEEKSVLIIKNNYLNTKEKLDELYGKDFSTRLTIMIYDHDSEFNSYAPMKQLRGFYLSTNESIHLESSKLLGSYEYLDVFVHEYTHFRTEQFINQHHIPKTHLPTWFNEGISQVEQYSNTYIDIELPKVIDFTNIDRNDKFHMARTNGYDPYLQSYFAVNELVTQHGMKVIPNILLVAKKRDFYDAFQKVTGTRIEKFQTTFLNRKEKINTLFDQADEAKIKKHYTKAESSYLEIAKLNSSSIIGNKSLSSLYLKEGQFDKAMEELQKMEEKGFIDYTMMSELYLLTNPVKALKYAEMNEEAIRLNTGNYFPKSNYIIALQKITSTTNPVSGYKQLYNEHLISYKIIQTALLKKIKQLYPNDESIQNLSI
ncbi:hypothetical protein [Bacillus sp. EAC]|uniref:hypothetical protein n=1 Tax=Bacillus sp. EAC TaxID=1978338 RepID=UPI000B436201|nr:hypothetical protein [Bacillus sp. EAC]